MAFSIGVWNLRAINWGRPGPDSVPRCCGLQRKPDQQRRQLALAAELILSHTGLALQAAMLPAANALRVALSRARARAGVCDGVL